MDNIKYIDNPSREIVHSSLKFISEDFQKSTHESYNHSYTFLEKVYILGNSDSLIHSYFFGKENTNEFTLYKKEDCIEGEYYPLHSLVVSSFGGDKLNELTKSTVHSVINEILNSSDTFLTDAMVFAQSFPVVKNFYIFELFLGKSKAFEIVYYPAKGYLVVLSPVIFGNTTKNNFLGFVENLIESLKEKALN